MSPTNQLGLLLGCAVAIGLAVRWPQISESLWLDELHTSWCTSGTWSEIPQRCQIGNQSPLYFYLAKISTEFFGLNEWALRLPSLIAGLLLVAAGGSVVWRWTQSQLAGFLCAVLLALDPICIFYSQEARPYACLMLVACCHVAIVAEISKRNNPLLRLAFVLGAVLLVYLHYTAILFVFAEAVYLFILAARRGSSAGYSWKHVAIDLMLIGLACLPAAVHTNAIMQRGSQWKSFVPAASIDEFFRQSRIHIHLVWLVNAVVAILVPRSRAHPKGVVTIELLLTITVFLVPFSIAGFASELDIAHFFFRRYLLPSYVAGIVLAALFCNSIRQPSLRGGMALLTVGISLWSSGLVQNYFRDGRAHYDRRQDWRAAVNFVNQQADFGVDKALVRGGFLEADLLVGPHSQQFEEYNLAPVNNIYRLKIRSRALPTSPMHWQPILKAELQAAAVSRCWFILNGASIRRRQLHAELEKNLAEIAIVGHFDVQREFGDVAVARFIKTK